MGGVKKQRRRRAKDRTGLVYGQLTAISPVGDGKFAWLCRCTCGTEKPIRSKHLRGAKSCGCHMPPPGTVARNKVISQYRRSARIRELEWGLDDALFLALTGKNCFYCDRPPSTIRRSSRNGQFVYNGIDRVDNGRGYVMGNVVTCCSVCNHAKHTMSEDDFLNWIGRVAAHQSRMGRLDSGVELQ